MKSFKWDTVLTTQVDVFLVNLCNGAVKQTSCVLSVSQIRNQDL